MAQSLLNTPTQYHRPMTQASIDVLVAKLATATVPPTANDFHFPMSQTSAIKVANAIAQLDTSGLIALTPKDLRDPWTQKTIDRLQAVVVP